MEGVSQFIFIHLVLFLQGDALSTFQLGSSPLLPKLLAF